MGSRRPSRWLRWWAAASVGLAPCGSAAGGHGRASLTVLAASSLTESFSDMARRFERSHPGSRVELAFAGSPTAVDQIRSGAPADVIAAADPDLLARLAAEGLVGPSRVFARNRPTVVVARGNPLGIRAVDDLARPGVDVVVCDPEVPCGRVAARVLARAPVAVGPRSFERNVKAVLTRVLLGEADAGVVYVTDVLSAAGRVDGVEIAGSDALVVDYVIAPVARTRHARAVEFLDYVASPAGRALLRHAGFEVP